MLYMILVLYYITCVLLEKGITRKVDNNIGDWGKVRMKV